MKIKIYLMKWYILFKILKEKLDQEPLSLSLSLCNHILLYVCICNIPWIQPSNYKNKLYIHACQLPRVASLFFLLTLPTKISHSWKNIGNFFFFFGFRTLQKLETPSCFEQWSFHIWNKRSTFFFMIFKYYLSCDILEIRT